MRQNFQSLKRLALRQDRLLIRDLHLDVAGYVFCQVNRVLADQGVDHQFFWHTRRQITILLKQLFDGPHQRITHRRFYAARDPQRKLDDLSFKVRLLAEHLDQLGPVKSLHKHAPCAAL